MVTDNCSTGRKKSPWCWISFAYEFGRILNMLQQQWWMQQLGIGSSESSW